MADEKKPQVLKLENEEKQIIALDPPPSAGQRLVRLARVLIPTGMLFATVLCCGAGASVAYKKLTAPVEIPPGGKLVVLPFAEMEKGAEHLVDPLTADLTAALARVPGLEVTPLDEAMKLKGDSRGIQEIGAALGVRYVLQAGVKPLDDRLRIEVSLVDVNEGGQVWGDAFARPMSELPNLEDGILRGVVGGTGLQGIEGLLVDRATEKPEAYEPLLRARWLCSSEDAAQLAQGIEGFAAAATLDPSLGEAHLDAAACWLRAVEKAGVPEKDAKPRAVAAVQKALEQEPSLKETPQYAELAGKLGL